MADAVYDPYASRAAAFLAGQSAPPPEEDEEDVQPLQPASQPRDPYAGRVAQFKARPAQPAIQSVIANVGISPDEYKGAKAIAKDVGIHARMLVDGTVDKGRARNQQLIGQTRAFVQAHPRIEKFLRDPDKSALTYDDLDQLRRVAQSVEAIKEAQQAQGLGEMLSNTGERIAEGAVDIWHAAKEFAVDTAAEAIFERQGIARRQEEIAHVRTLSPDEKAKFDALSKAEKQALLRPKALEHLPVFGDVYSGLDKEGAAIRDEMTRLAAQTGGGPVGEFLTEGTVAFTQLLPAAVATMITRNPALGARIMGSQIFVSEYKKAKQDGFDTSRASAIGFMWAGLEAATEAIPLGTLLEQGGNALTNILKTAGTEFAQEGAMEILQVLWDVGVLSKDTTVVEALQRVFHAGVVGGVAGTQMSLTMRGSQAAIKAVIGDRGPSDYTNRLEQAHKEVADAKLNVRDPEVMREALDAMSDDGKVFVAAEDLIELQQSGVLTNEDIAALQLEDALEEEAGRNGDIEVKVSAILTMDDKKFAEVSQIVRENIADVSSKESAQQLKDREQLISHLLQQMETQATADPEARPVYDAMRENLIAASGMPEDQANEVAAMVEEHYATIAAEDTDGAETAEEMFLRDHITLRKRQRITAKDAAPARLNLQQDDALRSQTVKIPDAEGTMRDVNVGTEIDAITQERGMTEQLLDCVNGR